MLAIILVLLDYSMSHFAKNPLNEIIVDHINTFEILDENIERPKNLTMLDSKDFGGKEIALNDYPWPFHEGSRNNTIKNYIFAEGREINSRYTKRYDYKQEELTYHPTAYLQEYSTPEKMAKAKGIKVRVTLQPYVGGHRVSNMYMPPGELVTFEYVTDGAIGKVSVTVSSQKQNSNNAYKYENAKNSYTFRYPEQSGTLHLNRKVNTWGYPFGGLLVFEYSGNTAVELIVTGCLKAPLFQYGVTDEVEFANEMKSTVVPKGAVDFGTTITVFHTYNYSHKVSRMGDLCEFYRSAKTRSQLLVKDIFNPKFDRVTYPNKFYFDDFVICGVACTNRDLNLNMGPILSSEYMVNFDSIITGENLYAWIVLHEMNHLHQTNWGYYSTLESSNNMHIMVEYVFQSTITDQKHIDLNGGKVGSVYHPAYTAYEFMFGNLMPPFVFYDQSIWSTMFLSFGYEKWLDYTNCCSNNVKFPDTKFTDVGRHILCATDAFKHNMYNYTNLDPSVAQKKWGDKKEAFLVELDKSPYKDITFHPISNFFANGFIRDGKKFSLGAPFFVEPASKTRFDFHWAMNFYGTRDNQFGDFEFHNLSFYTGNWKKINSRVYEYTSTTDINHIDEFIAEYVDKANNNKITQTYGTIKLSRTWLKNFTYETYSYGDYKKDLNPTDNIKKLYREVGKLKPTKTGIIDDYYVNGNIFVGHISVVHAYFVPTYDTSVNFAAKADNDALVYFSDEPLKGNPDDDKSKQILNIEGWTPSPDESHPTGPIKLVKGKKYYMDIILNYYDIHDFGIMMLYKNPSDSFLAYRDLPNDWFRIPGVTDEMLKEYEWKPDIVRMQGLNGWRGSNLFLGGNTKWKVIKHPDGQMFTNTNSNVGKYCENCKIEDVLFDGDKTTEFRANWYKDIGFAKFPHEFVIDFGEKTKFSFVRLTGAGNQNFFKMNSSVEIHVSDNTDDLNKSSTLVRSVRFISNDNKLIELGKVVDARYMSIVVNDNTFKWKGNADGRTDFSGIDIGLKKITAKTMDIPFNCKWAMKTGVGYGINGRYFIGKKGDTYEITTSKNTSQFGFIGAKFNGMGSATVYQNNAKVATISEDLINSDDRINLRTASKSYMQPLYVSDGLYGPTTFKIHVDSGEIWLTGILTADGGSDKAPIVPPQGGSGSGNPNDSQLNKEHDKNSGIKTGGIVGIVIAVIVLTVAAVLATLFIKKRFSNRDNSSNNNQISI